MSLWTYRVPFVNRVFGSTKVNEVSVSEVGVQVGGTHFPFDQDGEWSAGKLLLWGRMRFNRTATPACEFLLRRSDATDFIAKVALGRLALRHRGAIDAVLGLKPRWNELVAVRPPDLDHRDEQLHCYRCNQAICDFADGLYPDLPKSISQNNAVTGHDGIVHIKNSEVLEYCNQFKPMVLRWNKTTDTLGLPAFNFGAMKGRTFPHVLIFPTEKMKAYFATKDLAQAGDLSKFYVAVTRAQYSVAFVVSG
jgi:hypothetical protein